jgi:ubiquinone biosynthesis protein
VIPAIRTLTRMIGILWVVARHDLLTLMDIPGAAFLSRLVAKRTSDRIGTRLSAALVVLGPTFIKLGQALSTRADLVGEQTAADLSELQDQLAPFPGEQAVKIVESELGMPLSQAYHSFDLKPVAAASIAQVHFAVTAEGEDVAVKILRPNVERAFRRDLEMLSRLARWADSLFPSIRRLRLIEVVETLAQSVELEMDLRFEAAAAAEMAENFAGDSTFQIPAVDWSRTARRVLTLERVMGLPVDEREQMLAQGYDVTQILASAAQAFFNMVFRDGFFHADLHPGNLFVDTHGRLVAVDFGIMGRVDLETRHFLATMLIGFLNGDFRKVAEIHFQAGYVPAHKSLDAFSQAIRSVAQPILGKPINQISVARLLGQLFEVTETFAMETQPQLLLLQKSMLVAEGIGRRLDPTVNMWELARPLIEKWMRQNLGVKARVKATVFDIAHTMERLPRLLDMAEKSLSDMQSGGIRLHSETVRKAINGERSGPSWGLWLSWIVSAALAAALLMN